MKIFSEELVEKAVSDLHIADLSKATIGEVLLVAQYLEKQTGIPFVRMDQGSPGLPVNRYGGVALMRQTRRRKHTVVLEWRQKRPRSIEVWARSILQQQVFRNLNKRPHVLSRLLWILMCPLDAVFRQSAA